MNNQTIKISKKAYKELKLRKILTGVPIITQIDKLLGGSYDTSSRATKRVK